MATGRHAALLIHDGTAWTFGPLRPSTRTSPGMCAAGVGLR